MGKSLGAYITLKVKVNKFVSIDELSRDYVDLRKFAEDELENIYFNDDYFSKIKGKNYELVSIEIIKKSTRKD